MSSLPFEDFPHILDTRQFSATWLLSLFRATKAIEADPEAYCGILLDRIVALIFNQPSSRTYFSFELAARRLGATVIGGQHMAEFSSAAKGESLDDLARILLGYGADYLIVRWNTEGSVARVAKLAGANHPVINAGDGPGQHPTQSLVDLYTIWKEFGDLERPIVVAVIGDLKHGRTAHSLAYLLGKLFPNISFFFISPESARMKPEILEYLHRHGRHTLATTQPKLYDLADAFDVVYMTRPQLEYGDEQERARLTEEYQPFILTPDVVERMKPEAIILHPLPRTFELPVEVDGDPRARYFQQAANGLPLRMALLKELELARLGLLAKA